MKKNYLFWMILVSAALVIVLDVIFSVVILGLILSRSGGAAAFPSSLWVFGIVLLVVNSVMLASVAIYFVLRKIRR